MKITIDTDDVKKAVGSAAMKAGTFLGKTAIKGVQKAKELKEAQYSRKKDTTDIRNSNKFVSVVCTKCGTHLEVNSSAKTAVCQYCGTVFSVDKAVQSINIENSHLQTDKVEINRKTNYGATFDFISKRNEKRELAKAEKLKRKEKKKKRNFTILAVLSVLIAIGIYSLDYPERQTKKQELSSSEQPPESTISSVIDNADNSLEAHTIESSAKSQIDSDDNNQVDTSISELSESPELQYSFTECFGSWTNRYSKRRHVSGRNNYYIFLDYKNNIFLELWVQTDERSGNIPTYSYEFYHFIIDGKKIRPQASFYEDRDQYYIVEHESKSSGLADLILVCCAKKEDGNGYYRTADNKKLNIDTAMEKLIASGFFDRYPSPQMLE